MRIAEPSRKVEWTRGFKSMAQSVKSGRSDALGPERQIGQEADGRALGPQQSEIAAFWFPPDPPNLFCALSGKGGS